MIFASILLFLLFVLWSFNMVKGNLEHLDNKVYSYLHINKVYTKIFKIITILGSTRFFVLLSFLLLIFMKNKILASVIVVLLIISSGLIEGFKQMFKRERPNIKRLVKEKGYSFPSGHTTSSTSFFGFLIFLVSISYLIISVKIILIMLILVIILLIGLSRIYLGVHYFSDVIGAYLLASSYVLLYVYFVHALLKFV